MGTFRRPPSKPWPKQAVERTAFDMTTERLEQIADLIGAPVEALTNGAVPSGLDGAAELLEIWEQLATDADREALIAFARGLLEA